MKKKSLSVKRIKPKNLNFKKILKDKKILEIYRIFEKNFKNLNYSNKIAISISGGPDSMALCFLLSCFKYKNDKNIKLFFYLVDHGLREESYKEAQLVKKHLNFQNIHLKILKWVGKKPVSNIQSLARQKRYELIFNKCIKSNIKNIITAHHQDDLYETFFSRLLRGSGTEGLSSFFENEKKFIIKGKTLKLIRPLLSLNKEKLIYVSKKVFNFYLEDPSNDMEKFQRVKIRKLIYSLKDQGLDFKKLQLTLKNLSSTNKAINHIVDKNITENVIYSKNKYLINSNFFSLSDEIVFRSLSKLLKNISQRNYPPRGKKIMNLINEFANKDHFKATLGGTIIEKIHNSVVVIKEKTKKR